MSTEYNRVLTNNQYNAVNNANDPTQQNESVQETQPQVLYDQTLKNLAYTKHKAH